MTDSHVRETAKPGEATRKMVSAYMHEDANRIGKLLREKLEQASLSGLYGDWAYQNAQRNASMLFGPVAATPSKTPPPSGAEIEERLDWLRSQLDLATSLKDFDHLIDSFYETYELMIPRVEMRRRWEGLQNELFMDLAENLAQCDSEQEFNDVLLYHSNYFGVDLERFSFDISELRDDLLERIEIAGKRLIDDTVKIGFYQFRIDGKPVPFVKGRYDGNGKWQLQLTSDKEARLHGNVYMKGGSVTFFDIEEPQLEITVLMLAQMSAIAAGQVDFIHPSRPTTVTKVRA